MQKFAIFISPIFKPSIEMKLNSLVYTTGQEVICCRKHLASQQRYFSAHGQHENKQTGSQSQSHHDLSWEEEFRTKHFIPLTPLQKAIIYAGSGIASFLDPTKAGKFNS